VISNEDTHMKQGIPPVVLQDVLTRASVQVGVQVSSKKRLLERIASLLLEGNSQLDRKTVFQILVERERLGSTGIGSGVALPHGRASGLDRAIGALAVLETPIEFDALDGKEVNLVFGLLVPAECNEEHLRILAHLARLFSDPQLRAKLAATTDAERAYELVTTWRNPSSA